MAKGKRRIQKALPAAGDDGGAQLPTSKPAPVPESSPSPGPAAPPTPDQTQPKPKPETPLQRFLTSVQADTPDEQVQAAICEYMVACFAQHPIANKYNVLVLFDELSIAEGDADRIYAAAQKFSTPKPVLLVLHSPGGHIEPAYFVSKICREYSNGEFAVAVPRRAKSAATLICCGADAIHMGSMSELGPIDPQINSMPALGLKYAVQHLAELVKANPAAAEMFALYLSKSLPLAQLGYHERVAESAAQYAERLLASRKTKLSRNMSDLARKLVYEYKDHGFVIDAAEAQIVFGSEMILRSTEEYRFANEVYSELKLARVVANFVKRKFFFIGDLSSGCQMLPPNR